MSSSLRSLGERIPRRCHALAADPVELCRRADCDQVLGLRRALAPLLMRMKGPSRPLALFEEVSVPPTALPQFLQRLQNIFKSFDVSWLLDAHAGRGQVHGRDHSWTLTIPAMWPRFEPLAGGVCEAALACGSAVVGGNGRRADSRRPAAQEFGVSVSIFREIKDAFDPLGVLNPGTVSVTRPRHCGAV